MEKKETSLNKYQCELKSKIRYYRRISKTLSFEEQVEYLNKFYQFMNIHFMDIHSYANIKNNKNHKDFFLIGMNKTKQILENTKNLSNNYNVKVFRENLESYLEKQKLYLDIKITLLPKFSDDLTEYILDFL